MKEQEGVKKDVGSGSVVEIAEECNSPIRKFITTIGKSVSGNAQGVFKARVPLSSSGML